MDHWGENGTVPSSDTKDLREAIVMLRVLEDRQAQLKEALARLDTQLNAEGGMKDQLSAVKHESRATTCAGKWIAGLLAPIIVGAILGVLYWASNESMATRDAFRMLLNRPGVAGPQTPGK